MNNTKWRELQMGMYNLNDYKPQWRIKCINKNFISEWDREWFYHFSEGGYKDIEWVEIKIESNEQDKLVINKLKEINVPGAKLNNSYKVFGYISKGVTVDYL